MNAITAQDLLSAADYEQQRTEIRQRIIALKKRRRLAVGNLVTLVFENRETLLFQTQEMIRTERIVDPQKIQEELDVYNALLPQAGELSATLFIEITDPVNIQSLLDSFQGIDRSDTLSLRIGDQTSFAVFEKGHSKEDKISAVHFVRFPISHALEAQLTQLDIPAFLVISHPNYQAEVPIFAEMRQEWVSDLQS